MQNNYGIHKQYSMTKYFRLGHTEGPRVLIQPNIDCLIQERDDGISDTVFVQPGGSM